MSDHTSLSSTSLDQWLTNAVEHKANWENTHDTYFGYMPDHDTRVVYLAKLVHCYVPLELAQKFRPNINKESVGLETYCKIQFGPTANKVTLSSYKHPWQSPNVMIVRLSELLILPVPIDADAEFGANIVHSKPTSESLSRLENTKWTITNDIYNKGVQTCIKALDLAGNGDWESFQALNAKTPVYIILLIAIIANFLHFLSIFVFLCF